MFQTRRFHRISAGLIFLFCFAFSSQAWAAIRLDVSAGEDGFSMNYSIPAVGLGSILLEEPGDSDTLVIRIGLVKVAEIELTLIEIQDQKILLGYAVNSSMLPEEITGEPIPIPFGELGAVIDLLGRRMRNLGDRDVEISFLMLNNRSSYEVAVNLPGQIEGSWEGTATPEDNLVNEVVTNPADGSTLADINLIFEYDVPLFTNITYDISVFLTLEGVEGGDEGELEIPPIQGGPVPIPNGSYYIWFDLDADALPGPEAGTE